VFLSGDQTDQAGVLSFRLRSRDCEELGEELGRQGFALRAGLHCAPLAHETAGTLETGTLRASVSAFNTDREMEKFIQAVWELDAAKY
jgi:selenocysteine lyase/cysteine desulfurase